MNQRQSILILTVGATLLMATSLACGITAAKPTPNPLITPSATVSGEGTLIFLPFGPPMANRSLSTLTGTASGAST
jgi:hypothetical protein